MKRILLLCLLLAATPAHAQFDAIRTLRPDQGQEVKQPVEAIIFSSTPDELPACEAALLDIFQSPETTLEGQQYTCRLLRFCGSEASIPVLAPQLANPELSQFVRLVFQGLETSKADQALIDALPGVSEPLKVGIIGTLGQRGSSRSVKAIAPFLADTNPEIQFAAITALGNIGGKKAVKALASAEVKPEFSNDWKLARIQAAGNVSPSILNLFSQYTDRNTCEQFLTDDDLNVRCAALAGLTKANAKLAAPVVLAALDSDNLRFRNTAIGLLPLLPTEKLSSVHLGMKSKNEVLLINELARREAKEAEGIMIMAMSSDNEAVRTAAIQALGKIGGADSIGILIAAAPTDDTAYKALCGLNAEGTDAAIIQTLENAEDDNAKVKYIECLSARQAETALPLFIELAKDDWSRTGAAAIAGMANLVSTSNFATYPQLMLSTDNGKKIQALEKSLATAAQRMPDANACALPLITAFGQAEGEAKYAVIRSLGSVGGEAARVLLTQALNSPDPKIKDAAIRGLASWPTLDAADQLLELAQNADTETQQVLALRGYIRLAGTLNEFKPAFAMCLKATEATDRPAELKAVISCVKKYKNEEVLNFLALQYENPAVATEAGWAICEISSHWSLKQPSIPILERIAKTTDTKLADEADKRIKNNTD